MQRALSTSWLRVAAALTTLAFAGCGSQQGGGDTTVPGGGSADTPEPPASTTPPPPAEDASKARIKQTVRGRETTDGTVEIGILGLEVRGKLATLTLAFTPRYPSVSPGEEISVYDMNGENSVEVALIDPVGVRRYEVVGGIGAQGLGTEPSEVSTEAVNNSSVTARYIFAAPPPNVTKIDVQVADWPIFRDVPIQR